MRALIDYVARSLVDYPEAVVVSEQRRGDRVILSLRVAEEDLGKVIGREGRVANAIRTLLKAGNAQSDRQYQLEVR